VGLALDDPAKSIVVAARAGEAGEFLGTFPRTWAADPSKATCPAGEAIRSGKVVVVDDLVRETASAVIARQALEGNVEKAVYLPLKNALRTFGVLAVCSSERGRVNEDEIDLLAELADNIAFGIASLRAQTEQARADTALLASLKEKEALLREVHHRVKNNLQIINSLLRLEARRVGHDVTKSVLQEMQGRIQSMAVLHETLYRSGNFAAVDLGAYLRQLANQLFRALLVRSGAVRLNLDLVSVSVDIDKAIPCGLIVNELVTNSLKHGFADERTGDLWIGLRPAEDGVSFTLSVSDNGAGLPADFDLKRQASLGLQLVSDLARQLQGDLKIGPGPQAAFEVTFNPGRRRATTEIPSPVDRASGTGEFSRADG
jgi:two-component sensor histidine kinase